MKINLIDKNVVEAYRKADTTGKQLLKNGNNRFSSN